MQESEVFWAPLRFISLRLCLQCGPGGCLIELAQQLFIIMVGKQLINNVQEFILPYVSWFFSPCFLILFQEKEESILFNVYCYYFVCGMPHHASGSLWDVLEIRLPK